ncbi:MAG: SurA N-terminal domain-containing protein [Bacteroidota bacterium]|nr:SurA N-terminal domain-containing protein [Bacteroidota bacterium]
MALINKLREKMGTVVVIAVGFAIVSFIAADLLGPQSALFGNNRNEVGEIAGEDVTIQEYQNQVEELKYNYSLQTQKVPTENEMIGIRQQAWDYLIVKKAFQKQFDKLGLTVTDEEVVDMVQGNNIHPDLVQAFTNPETGEFDKNQVLSFLQNIPNAPPQQQEAWYNFERNLPASRLRIKYDNLLLMSTYVTSEEARREYQKENSVAEVKYLYIPYYSISDTAITVTDASLKEYLKENKAQYKVEESRSVNFVAIPIHPSPEDSAFFKRELESLQNEFSNIQDDSTFARNNTDGTNAFQTFKIGELPQRLQANVSNITEGDVRGPYYDEGTYRLFKISSIEQDTLYSARASHILIRPEGEEESAKVTARQEAERILKEIRAGASFEEMARQHSDDPSASRGGDLGWFTQGRMVQPFEEAVFGTNNEGLVNRVVETTYGFHIIKITEPRTNTNYKIATIERHVAPSDESRDQSFRKADNFAASATNDKEFVNAAVNEGLIVQQATQIDKNAIRVGNLGNARELVRWLYNQGSVGKVSQVFEVDGFYVVAVMTGKTDKGIASLEDVREEITSKVNNKLKADQIVQRFNNLQGSLEEVATNYGVDAKVHTSSDLKLNSNSLPNVGFAPAAIGKVFALQQGQRSVPLAEENGVVIMELQSITEAPEVADYASYKTQIQQREQSRASYEIMEAVKENAEIKDHRYRFF